MLQALCTEIPSTSLAFQRGLTKLNMGCRLAAAGVGTVFCLQEDSDMAYFSLDINPIITRCQERGDIKHVRFPIRCIGQLLLKHHHLAI